MSFFVKGKNQPSTCSECPCCYNYECFDVIHYFCAAKENAPDISGISAGTLPDCPIVRTPETHGRLIDADYLLNKLKESIYDADAKYRWAMAADFVSMIESIPSIIEVE